VGGKNLKQVEEATKPKQVVVPLINKTIRYGPDEPPPALEEAENRPHVSKDLPDDQDVKYDIPGEKQDAVKTEAKHERSDIALFRAMRKVDTVQKEDQALNIRVDSEKVSMQDFMNGKHHGLYVPSKRKRAGGEAGSDSKRRKGGFMSQILRNNKIGENLDAKTSMDLDIATRPDESDINYNEVPIEQYGKAMLFGMGWDPKVGIGKNPQVVKPVDAHIRNRNQGLGAELAPYVPRRVLKPGEKLPRQKQEENRKRQEKLERAKQEREKSRQNEKKKKKKKKRRKPPVTWVLRSCIVRIVTKDLGTQYYCKKGIVVTVISQTDFLVKMVDRDETLTLCEDQVETVVPKKNKPIIFVKGKRKGKIATLSEKYKSKEKVLVQMQEDLQLITTSYDKICAVETNIRS